jgi:cell volume regulation protein A
MFPIDRLILVAALLLLLAIVSSKLSTRLGVPFLVVFVAIGMLAGSEGIGGIAFEDYAVANGVGTVALAIILFDGGLRTSGSAFRAVWAPGVALATVGVIVTSAITGAAATLLLGLSLMEGLLLGAIVGSTDAAAVFALFRSANLHVDHRLAATVEVESGSNDPMAIFLTITLLEILTGAMEPGPTVAISFLTEMSIGAVAGIGMGLLGARVVNRIELDAAGLYPVLGSACGLLAYGLAASLGGSGFLAIYLAGIVLGNSRIVFQRGLFFFHDGLAWLAQLVMFMMLGLLSFPSRLVAVAAESVAIAAVLTLVARPVATFLSLAVFRFHWREVAFISWAGLKGAVPIFIATYPLFYGLEGAGRIFDVVFFVVLASAITQGWSLPWVARILGLERPPEPVPPMSLEITSLRHVDGDIVGYTVVEDARANGRQIRDLALPDGVVVALIARGDRAIPPRGSTRLEPGDFVFVLLRPDTRPLVDRVFAPATEDEDWATEDVRFPLRGSATFRDLEEFYGIVSPGPPEQTLSEFLRDRLGSDLAPGARVELDRLTLLIRSLDGDVVETVELLLPARDEPLL